MKKWTVGVLCGFGLVLVSLAPATASTIGFTGAYDVANWTLTKSFGVDNTGGVDTSSAPVSIVLESDNWGDALASNVDFTFVAFEAAVVKFAWSFDTTDTDGPAWDPFGFLLNGAFLQLSDSGGGNPQNGIASFSVNPGDVFGFRARAVDSGFGPAFTTISDFQVPEPSLLLLMGSSFGLVAARRRFGFK